MGDTPLRKTEGHDTACIHATCVSVEGCGILILGPAGAGKSGLALQMMALGASLVSDDQVALTMQTGEVIADAPQALRGLVEARGIGLLRANPAGAVPIRYVVDLGQTETARLPEHEFVQVLRQTVPLLRGEGLPNLAAALMQLARLGRVDPEWPNT